MILRNYSPIQLIKYLLDPPLSLQFDKAQKEDLLIFGALAIDRIWKWRNKVVHENLQPSMIQAQTGAEGGGAPAPP